MPGPAKNVQAVIIHIVQILVNTCLLYTSNFDCPQEDLSAWLTYFDCATDYAAILASVDPDDNYLKAAAAAGRGIRILRQDPWEMIITFVISQQKTIPCIRRLVDVYKRQP